MRGKTAGTRREHQVRDWLLERDWVVVRASGSLGCADLVALKAGTQPLMVEVKSTARGPYAGFPPADRADLRQTAEWAGAAAVLAWWPPRGELRLIPAAEWPVERVFKCVVDESAGLREEQL